jgi:AraC-like DNA-binding protein
MAADEELFRYDYVHLLPKQQVGLNAHEQWELSYIITGSGMRLIGDRTEPFESGEIVLIPPMIPHCWYFDDTSVDSRGRIANVSVFFHTTLLENISNALPQLEPSAEWMMSQDSAVKLGKAKEDTVSSILLDMRREDEPSRLVSFQRIMLALSSGSEDEIAGRRPASDKIQQRLNEIRSYVICNAERHISLDDIARHVGMNRSSFCVFFKKETGKPFVDFLNEYRISVACKLLVDTGLEVADICFRSGFNSIPYFNRAFLRYAGTTPLKYRKRCHNLL